MNVANVLFSVAKQRPACPSTWRTETAKIRRFWPLFVRVGRFFSNDTMVLREIDPPAGQKTAQKGPEIPCFLVKWAAFYLVIPTTYAILGRFPVDLGHFGPLFWATFWAALFPFMSWGYTRLGRFYQKRWATRPKIAQVTEIMAIKAAQKVAHVKSWAVPHGPLGPAGDEIIPTRRCPE